eukprot:TRINITY_DN2201_c0_g1_i1.p1 TRINITY_DN2201_c0_g1~~TRINITY_DN2201_c0_g1_i1.p1  ORF type:complete len:107 (-),score=32.88 TRINITY_DN2201_c0_g1_i1:160-480(-)
MVKEVSSAAEFKAEIASGKAIVDFTATWCGPCRMIAPMFEEMSKDPQFAAVKFLKVDVDQLSDVAREYSVQAMPTFKFFKDGQEVETVVGANIDKIKQLLKNQASR